MVMARITDHVYLSKFGQALQPSMSKRKKKRQIIINLINKSLIDKNQNIIDAGAFLGDTSLPLSLNITGNLYTIDP